MESRHNTKKRHRKVVIQPRFYLVLAIFVIVLILLIALIWSILAAPSSGDGGEVTHSNPFSGLFATATPTATPTPTFTPTPSPTPEPTPHAIDSTKPENYGYTVHLEVDGADVVPGSYLRSEAISFDDGGAYTDIPGIFTFRGNNYRNAPSYGTVNLTEKKLTQVWEVNISYLAKNSGSGSWSGSGWTGQPLMVQWPKETKKIMNMYDWAKEKDGLVEVIYATMDGNVYFLDLDSGEATRPKLSIGMPFKGTGSVDPRGYPLLYLGSGDEYDDDSMKSRAMIYSLIDFSRLYEFGKQDSDSFAKRVFYAYDSAPLVDAETDTLIYPAENGVLYTMKLNTKYDETAGTISIAPSTLVKYRYDSKRSSTGIDSSDLYWLGYEDSAVVWGHYIYLAANDGLFQCIDLNTMNIVWVSDTLDDTNGTPVLEVISSEEAYLYVGTSLHFTKDANNTGVAPFFKINAMTGEIVKQYGLTVHTVSGVSGGIQSTAALGEGSIDNLVIVSIARTPNMDDGVLVALDRNSFEVVWQFTMQNYAWSSPCIVYGSDGAAYVLQADSKGNLFLLDGTDGTLLNTLNLTDSNFEASPAVYGNMLVLGCRGQKIFGVRIS